MASMKSNISRTKNLLAAVKNIKQYDGTVTSWRTYKKDVIAIMKGEGLYGIIGLLTMEINAKDIFTSFPYNPTPKLVEGKVDPLSESAQVVFKPHNNLTLDGIKLSEIIAGAEDEDESDEADDDEVMITRNFDI